MKKFRNVGMDVERAHRISATARVAHDDLTNTTNAASQSIVIGRVLAGTVVRGFGMRLVTPFEDEADGAHNDTQVKVGDGVDDDRLLTATQINRNGTEVLIKWSPSTVPAVYDVDTDIVAVFSSMTGKNLAALTKGEIAFVIDATNLDKAIS